MHEIQKKWQAVNESRNYSLIRKVNCDSVLWNLSCKALSHQLHCKVFTWMQLFCRKNVIITSDPINGFTKILINVHKESEMNRTRQSKKKKKFKRRKKNVLLIAFLPFFSVSWKWFRLVPSSSSSILISHTLFSQLESILMPIYFSSLAGFSGFKFSSPTKTFTQTKIPQKEKDKDSKQ